MKKTILAAILVLSALSASATPLVTNGDFETGTFAGWTLSGDTSTSVISKNNVTSNTTNVWRSGASDAETYISQVLTTVANASYTLSFDVYTDSTSGSSFSASFGGNVVSSFVNEVHNWTHYSVTNLVAGGTSTELKLGARNDPRFTRVDNISVVQTSTVPEPASMLLLSGAFAALALTRRRKARKAV